MGDAHNNECDECTVLVIVVKIFPNSIDYRDFLRIDHHDLRLLMPREIWHLLIREGLIHEGLEQECTSFAFLCLFWN